MWETGIGSIGRLKYRVRTAFESASFRCMDRNRNIGKFCTQVDHKVSKTGKPVIADTVVGDEFL